MKIPGGRRTIWIAGASVLVLAAAAVALRGCRAKSDTWQTVRADRGTIVQTVLASGTLNPITLVTIGSQVSGRLQTIRADFNDRVAAGDVLAQLDPALYESQLTQAEANLSRARVDSKNAGRALSRAAELHRRTLLSESELELAQAARDNTAATVKQAEAGVKTARTNLEYTTIRSPIAGIVVSRAVEPGQTVAASLQSPTLFTIADDLARMQIVAAVDEADIGAVRDGIAVTFNVDAYPGEEFSGKVRQVRLAPNVQQGVVTYDVIVAVANTDGRLRPGMTANVSILTVEKTDVLRVPNAALRFQPSAELWAKIRAERNVERENGGADPSPRGTRGDRPGGPPGGGGGMGGGGARGGGPGAGDPAAWMARMRASGRAMLFILDGKKVKPTRVKLGVSDGSFTEIAEGELVPGAEVITGVAGAAGAPTAARGGARMMFR